MLHPDDKSYKIVHTWLLNRSELINSYKLDNFHNTSLIVIQHILDRRAPLSITFNDLTPELIEHLDKTFIQVVTETLILKNFLTFCVFIPFLFLAFDILSEISAISISLLITLISHYLFNTKIKLILASLVTEARAFKDQKIKNFPNT